MANVDITLYDASAPLTPFVQTGTGSSVTSSDVCRIPHHRHTILRISNGATTTNVTIKCAQGNDVTFQINNGKTVWVRLTDSADFLQSDGMWHLITDQTITVQAVNGH